MLIYFGESKYQLLTKKKELKQIEECKHVYMYEDLTVLRNKMMKYIKNRPNVKNVYSRDRLLHCNRRDGSQIVWILQMTYSSLALLKLSGMD